jgi:hypothetical protein
MKKEAAISSEMSVNIHHSRRRHREDDGNFRNYMYLLVAAHGVLHTNTRQAHWDRPSARIWASLWARLFNCLQAVGVFLLVTMPGKNFD